MNSQLNEPPSSKSLHRMGLLRFLMMSVVLSGVAIALYSLAVVRRDVAATEMMLREAEERQTTLQREVNEKRRLRQELKQMLAETVRYSDYISDFMQQCRTVEDLPPLDTNSSSAMARRAVARILCAPAFTRHRANSNSRLRLVSECKVQGRAPSRSSPFRSRRARDTNCRWEGRIRTSLESRQLC